MQVEGNENFMVIRTERAPLIIRLALTVVLVILILAPIAAMIYRIIWGNGPHLIIAVVFLFNWALAWYLLRVILWNSFGREEYILESEQIVYQANYGWFRDGTKVLENNNLEVGIQVNSNDPGMGRLILSNELQSIHSVIEVSVEALQDVVTMIADRYQSRA